MAKLSAILSENVELRLYMKTMIKMISDLSSKVELLSSDNKALNSKVDALEPLISESTDAVDRSSRPLSRAGSKRRKMERSHRSHSSVRSYSRYRRVPQNSENNNAEGAQPENTFGRGTRAPTSSLKTVRNLFDYKKVFVSGLHLDTKAENVYNYLKNDNQLTPNRVIKLNSRSSYQQTASFCVVMEDEDYEKCNNPDCWPGEVIFKPFEGSVGYRLMKEVFPPQSPTSSVSRNTVPVRLGASAAQGATISCS